MMTVSIIDATPAPSNETEDLPLERVEQEICRLSGQIAAATSRFLKLLADFDARRGWAGWNVKSCAHWLSWRCGLDLRTAREHVRVARALSELPRIRAAFDAGRISYSKVRAIARVATPTSEADLLQAALHAPAAHIERLTKGLRTAQRNSTTPDDLGLKPQSARTQKHRIRWHWDNDSGDLIITGRLAPEDGARLLAAATRTAMELDRRNEPTDPPSTDTKNSSAEPSGTPQTPDQTKDPDQTRDPDQPKHHPDQAIEQVPAEPGEPGELGEPTEPAMTTRPPADLGPALIAMADMACTQLECPVHAPAADVQVTVDIQTLAEAFADKPTEAESDHEDSGSQQLHRQARLDDGPALAAASLRRLADDGRLRFAVNASDGRLLDVGRARRTPNTSQLRALWRRDHGCAVPGCGRIRFLHAHHVIFWTNGGRTDLDNLILLCGEHHRALHDGAFTITALGRQQFRFNGPDGTLYTLAPTIQGTANDLAADHPEIEPETIQPDWDGAPVHNGAISAFLTIWNEVIRRSRTDQKMAG